MPNNASPIDLLILFIFALLLLLVCANVILRASNKTINVKTDAKSKIYAQQLQELNKDVEDGRINNLEFEAAKSEILRRILRHSNQEIKELKDENAPKTALFAIGFLAVLTCLVYFLVGQPNLRDLPTFKREKEILSRPPETLTTSEIMLILQSRAQKDKADPTPHLLMGKVLLSQGRANDALHAFQAVLRRDNKNAESLAEIGGTIFELNGGKIDEEFTSAINAALQIEPNNLSASFYKGLGFWRNEKKELALKTWEQAYKNIGENENSRIGFLARIIDELSKLDMGPKMGGGMGDAPPMMDKTNPQDFINSMIARRTQKLLDNPNDIGIRLSLSRVLARTDYNQSKEILNDGLKIHNSEFERAIIETAIKINTKDGVK